MSKIDWQKLRAEFPSLDGRTFLNTATFGQLPRSAVEAVNAHWQRRERFACTDFLDWYDDADRLRSSIAKLIHAPSGDDIAFVGNTAAALGIVAGGLDWKPGDNLVTLDDDFPMYLYMPALVERHGVEARGIGWDRFWDAIDERTRMVAFAEVDYATGFRLPLNEIVPKLKERGIVVFVDGTQSLGALEFDIQKTQPDVYAVHGYKWLISPTGAGFFYISPELREKIPVNAVGWRSHKTWRNVNDLHHGRAQLSDRAEKYEAGGLMTPLLCGMEASVDLLLETGPEAIEERVLSLAASARARLRTLGAEVRENASSIVAARFEGQDLSRLVRELKDRGVIVAARHGYLRVSPHFYNTGEDFDRLHDGLRALL